MFTQRNFGLPASLIETVEKMKGHIPVSALADSGHTGHSIIIKHGHEDDVNELINKHGREMSDGNKVSIISKGNAKHIAKLAHPDNSDAVKVAIARHGTKNQVHKLVNDKSKEVRRAVVRFGHKEHLDKMLNDHDHDVKEDIVRRKVHSDHLTHLMHDEDPRVREEVARHGDKKHLDHLVNDSDSWTRAAVAEHGHKEHLDKLVDDKAKEVRVAVAKRGDVEHLQKLAKDKEPQVHGIAQTRLKKKGLAEEAQPGDKTNPTMAQAFSKAGIRNK